VAVAAIVDRIAAGIDELARARRARDLDTAAVLPGPQAGRRRRLAGPDLEFGAFAPGGGCRLVNPATGSGLRSASGPAAPVTVPAAPTAAPCRSAHQGRSGN